MAEWPGMGGTLQDTTGAVSLGFMVELVPFLRNLADWRDSPWHPVFWWHCRRSGSIERRASATSLQGGSAGSAGLDRTDSDPFGKPGPNNSTKKNTVAGPFHRRPDLSTKPESYRSRRAGVLAAVVSGLQASTMAACGTQRSPRASHLGSLRSHGLRPWSVSEFRTSG